MTEIRHHVPDWMMRDYVAGALSYPFALVVATHASICDECRARLGAHETLGGAALDQADAEVISADLRQMVLARIDDATPSPPRPRASGVYPGPLVEALKGRPPRWRSLGLGVRQCMLHDGHDGSARLLFIPPEQAVPEHGHNGTELTLVLQGSFHDETAQFGVGDMEVADSDLTHIPIAGSGPACICLAATDAPLRFKGFLPRLTQRFFRI